MLMPHISLSYIFLKTYYHFIRIMSISLLFVLGLKVLQKEKENKNYLYWCRLLHSLTIILICSTIIFTKIKHNKAKIILKGRKL